MYRVKTIDGQTYSNRVRLNLAQLMDRRGMPGYVALPSLSQSGLYKFVAGGGDMTITRLQHVADDLGVSIFTLLSHPDAVHAEES